jgi:hypothetical protein
MSKNKAPVLHYKDLMLIWFGIWLGPPASRLYESIMKGPQYFADPTLDFTLRVFGWGVGSLLFAYVAAIAVKKLGFFR